MTSELLDDYEEGSWTPTITAHTGTNPTLGGSMTSGGWYTKIGNTVTIGFKLDFIELSGTTSGMMKVSGIPFSVHASQNYNTGAVGANNIDFAREDDKVWISLGQDGFGIISADNAAAWGWELCSIAEHVYASFRGGMTYQAA